MNSFTRYIGATLVIIGVLCIAIPAFMGKSTNLSLIIGIVLEVIGFALHIILNRSVMAKEEKHIV